MEQSLAQELLKKTESIMRDAGNRILSQLKQPKDIHHKGRIDLVTQTDIEVEKYLQEHLQTLSPTTNFLSEESTPTGELKDMTWIIDPLDGTTNFAHGLFPVAISIALWCDNRIALGLVYIPTTQEMFTAIQGSGAFLNHSPIQVSQENILENSLIATGFPYDIDERLDEVLSPFQKVLARARGIRRMGAAAIDLAYTACGRFEGFYEQGLKPWDTAAGWLLVQEAGGMVTEFSPERPFTPYSPSILATNGAIHRVLGELLA
jgi:myo-inositol-1(or 4)-monophosphatase